jgi:hypothetical protein
MASIRQINGRWQAQVRRNGLRTSGTVASQAQAWADRLEAPLRRSAAPLRPVGLPQPPETFGAVLRRYQDQELPKHRSGATEVLMLYHLHRHWIAAVPCEQLTSAHLAAYRDERLQAVKPGPAAAVDLVGDIGAGQPRGRGDLALAVRAGGQCP